MLTKNSNNNEKKDLRVSLSKRTIHGKRTKHSSKNRTKHSSKNDPSDDGDIECHEW